MKDNSSADFIAIAAILLCAISGTINFHLWSEVDRLSILTDKQAATIQTMERTLLLQK